MSTLNATIRFLIDGTFDKAADLMTPQGRIAFAESKAFANGTGVNQGNEYFTDTNTLASTSKTYDLRSGEVNAYGEALVFDKIRALFIHNKQTINTGAMSLHGDVIQNTSWIGGTTPVIRVPFDGWYIATNPIDGYTVSTPSQHELTITVSSATIEYDLIIIGTT